ncbi:hypothetical protein [Chitinolyticbacter meiyuanensis]|uniref:hypothetical protein n=1 Tax=Chitinolyticbacter meiyuanensis TaxID=682798 RepID=UPI0011E605A1|nr:hypothetical protein [Chitinolyticbacter meiyuanensis]
MPETAPLDPALDRRIVIIGSSGAGKTTLARQLSGRLNAAMFDLDELHWGPDWTPKPRDEFVGALQQAATGEVWTASGNYQSVRELLWSRATTLIWLDYRFATVFSRLFVRSVRRLLHREVLWQGNRESWRATFSSRQSILWWLLTTYHRRRREYRQLQRSDAYPHLRWIVLHTPAEAERLLAATPLRGQSDPERTGTPNNEIPSYRHGLR